jgi:hypothetical protein
LCGRGGGGKVERRYEEKTGCPSTVLKYLETAYFLIPSAKLLYL